MFERTAQPQLGADHWRGPAPIEARPWPLWRVFALAFTLVLVVGLAVTFLRVPAYRSTATLLIAPPSAFSQQDLTGLNSQYVAVQRQLLLSRDLLDATWARLQAEDLDTRFPELSRDQLERSLSVNLLPENIVQMHVEGPEPERLEAVALAWLKTYRQSHTEGQANEESSTLSALAEESGELTGHLTEKRRQVEAFAERHNITSRVREENDALSQLSGLSSRLAEASGEVVDARARLESLQAAAARGEISAEGELGRELASMRGEAARLKGRLDALRQRYTEAYMQKDPAVVAMQDDYQQLVAAIADMQQQAQAETFEVARRELQQAQALQQGLQQQLSESDARIREFSEHFARYEEMLRELEQIEALAHAAEQRRVSETVGNRNRAPQITVLDWPRTPDSPFYPQYGRDAAISLGAALLAGLLALWAYLGMLRHRTWVWPASGPISASAGPGLQAGARPLLEEQAPAAVPGGAAVRLPLETSARELMPGEVRAMLAQAPPAGQLLLALLLAGVRPEELGDLQWQDLAGDHLDLRGRHPRRLRLSPSLCELVAAARGNAAAEAGPVWADGEGQPLAHSELEAMVCCAALDAGLTDAEQIGLETLHLTYLTFLARQGLRLADLVAIVGQLSRETLALLARCAPGRAAAGRGEVQLEYPLGADGA